MKLLTLFACLCLAACSNSPDPAAKKAPAPVHEPPKDLSEKFIHDGQTKMTLVPDHLLGKDFLPGGNLADYSTPDGKYQVFLFESATAQRAGFYLLDAKAMMPDARYLAHMGGYAGLDKGKPFYIFTKGIYVVGISGLDIDKADLFARRFAERL